MLNMKPDDIVTFLKSSIIPLKDQIYGDRYRAAVYLIDGTYLPCVVLQSKKAQVDLALRRFEQLRKDESQYRMVVESFVSAGCRLADYDIKTIEASPFAWPLETLKMIHGETVMAWTAFVVEMRDGTMYSYGTSFRFEFFDLPNGYSHADIVKIHSGMVYSAEKGLMPFYMEARKEIQTYRERPFFTCYLKEL
jgi:hypothetical protein